MLTVPRSAVIQTGPQAVVYVEQGGGAYAHTPITLGRRGDTHIEVLSGLREGDEVVTNGNLLIDGQAEMNRAFMSPPEATGPVTATKEITDEQKKVIAEFLTTADAMAAALAADDLEQFNKASEPAMNVAGSLVQLGRDRPPGGPGTGDAYETHLDALDAARHFHGFDDIKSARIAFHTFSVAAVAVLEPMRKAGQTPAFEIYECGMVDEAIPKVPKKARWIQTANRPLANPFFGAEMLECGKTIRP